MQSDNDDGFELMKKMENLYFRNEKKEASKFETL